MSIIISFQTENLLAGGDEAANYKSPVKWRSADIYLKKSWDVHIKNNHLFLKAIQ